LGTSNGGIINIPKTVKETVNAIASTSGTINVDATVAPVHTVTLNDDTQFNFTNLQTNLLTKPPLELLNMQKFLGLQILGIL